MIECSQCGKFLSRRDNLLRHIKSVHNHNRVTVSEERSPVKHAVTLDVPKNGDGSSGREKSGANDNDMNQSQNIDKEFRTTTTNNYDHMSESDDNNSYYKDDSRTHTIREAIKTKVNALKRMNGNMDKEEGTSPVTMEYIEEEPKRVKLSRATENDERNNFRKKPEANDSEHEHDDDDMDQPQNIEREFRTATNNDDHMSESDDNKSYYEGDSSKDEDSYDVDSSNEDSYGNGDDYSSEDDENIEPTTRKIYWNDPNKLVDRLQELVSTESGQEIFSIIAELRKADIIQ